MSTSQPAVTRDLSEESQVPSAKLACSIRAAQARDCGRIAELAVQLGYPCTESQVRTRLAQMQDANQYAVFVAEMPGDKIAGWIGVYIFRAVELDPQAEISGLVVDENFRSRRIGKMLLDAAEGWGRCHACDAIAVNSNVIRDRAHRFYTSNGYTLIKTQKIFRKDL